MRRRHTHWALMTGVQTYALPISLTMVLGALGALAQNDLRRMAGFAVIAGIGNVMAGVAIGGSTGTSGDILYVLHSMVTMTALYLLLCQAARIGGSWSPQSPGGTYQTRHGTPHTPSSPSSPSPPCRLFPVAVLRNGCL